jgi:serine-type D-Ala-D-Ala carboxypeptidase/endopeptidase
MTRTTDTTRPARSSELLRVLCQLALLCGWVALASAQGNAATPSAPPSAADQALDRQVRALVEPLLPRFGNAAVMVAVVDAAGDKFFSFGRVAQESEHGRAPDPGTLFEIGSITKVFTGLLLGDMVLRGEVDLDDPVANYLPVALRPPTFNGRAISLRDLVTHTSGLGYLPLDMPAMRRQRGEQVPEQDNIGHPNGARYTRERLAADLRSEQLQTEPGTHYAYSPLGFGLLGLALSERAGVPFASLLRERILKPLKLRDSEMMGEAHAWSTRYAEGHDDAGQATFFRSDDEALAACCGLRASARDLARLLRAQFQASDLTRVVQFAQYPQRRGGNTFGEHIGLGWHVLQRPRSQLYKFGQMNGHRAFIEVNPLRKRGVVVLAAHARWPVEDVARALLPRETLDIRSATEVHPTPVATAAGASPAQTGALAIAAKPSSASSIASFADGLELVTMSATPLRIRAGDQLELRLQLTVSRPIARNYQFFVHAESAAGRLIGDHAPSIPTDHWLAPSHVEQRVSFHVPRDYPSGTLQLWFGLFDAAGRAHVVGEATEDDRVRGPSIVIER